MTERQLGWMAGGGAMAELIATKDWSSTPLGAIETWPQSLRTTVSLCLASNFPINIIWGDGANQIYNDGYRVVCGAVHPRAMGEDYRLTWASAWPAIGGPFDDARAGRTRYLENQRMFLERNGYPEETFFTYSVSPIRDEAGRVAGLFHPVVETTATILGERRTRALRDIADHVGRATVFAEACDLLLPTLAKYPFDVPFAALYLADAETGAPRLHGVTGLGAAGGGLAPARVGPDGATWPLAMAKDRVVEIGDVVERFGPLAAEVYPEPIQRALLIPIRLAAVDEPLGHLVIGASPRLPFDESYRSFVELLASATSAALGNARAYEMERLRAESLAALDRAKTTFFSNVSHEFRTPLTLLLGPLDEMLAQGADAMPEHMRRDLEIMQRNAVRLLKLVNALLDFSRVEASRTEASLEETDLGLLTSDLASAFRSAIERAGMELVVDVEEPGPVVAVDRDLWEKIVLNLLSNAFKFTHVGAVRVTLRADERWVQLTVSDTGIGIDEAQLPRVFERFHRVEGAKGRSHEGTGIGLALVRDLAALHGGTARVESAVGVGSSFFVRIPRQPMDAAARPASSPAPRGPARAAAYVAEALRWGPSVERAAPAEAAHPAPTATILLADDNADMRDYVRRLLEPRYRVIAVANGAEALATARSRAPDLLLSDVMMPMLDGVALVAQLRADPDLKTLPVILLSARAGEDEMASGLALGADDYMTKPFAAKELLARVHAQLSMSELRRRSAAQEVRAMALIERQRELKQLLDARDEFLSIASHELRTPITSLRLQVEMTARASSASQGRGASPERVEKMLRISTAQLERISSLVDDLLDVARVRTGRLTLSPEPMDAARLVRDALERLAATLAASGNDVVLDAPANVPVTWDGRRVEQVLTNLLANAVRYAPGTRIELALESRGDRVRIDVRDHGPGIGRDLHDLVFERFDRGLASRNAGGLGLGLYLARQIVEAHGGTIASVAPDMGDGARFVVDLPAVTPLAAEAPPVQAR